jgi:hypothetical protein
MTLEIGPNLLAVICVAISALVGFIVAGFLVEVYLRWGDK